MLAVVNIRGDRLCHGIVLSSLMFTQLNSRDAAFTEHIWWDQATALRQAGILPIYMSHSTSQGPRMIRLPVAGAEAAAKLVNETSVASNAMFNGSRDPEGNEF